MSFKAGRIAALGATLAAVGAMAVATTSASAAFPVNCEEAKPEAPLCENFTEFEVFGSLGIKKLNQTIELKEGKFNGYLELLSLYPITGIVHGVTTVKPFEVPIKLFGISSKVALTFEQVGNVNGSLTQLATATGSPNCEQNPSEPCVNLSVPTEVNIGFTSLTIFGFKFPLHCKTSKPFSLPLSENLRLNEELLDFEVGSHFTGTDTFPSVTCSNELFASLNSSILTSQFSGPENTYSLFIRE